MTTPSIPTQICVDGILPPSTSSYILPHSQLTLQHPFIPFYQWGNNNGYCAETCLVSSSLFFGQFINQFNARCIGSIFPPAIAQTGEKKKKHLSFFSQLSLVGLTTTSKFNDFKNAAINLQLNQVTYDTANQPSGLAGYQNFMSFVKKSLINGAIVTIGVIMSNQTQDYDHIVTVTKIGTNHDINDPTYYPDDVIYIEDHGVYSAPSLTFENNSTFSNSDIPPGSYSISTGQKTSGYTPYIYGYTFDDFCKPITNNKHYGLAIPTSSHTSGEPNSDTGACNYGCAIFGVNDPLNETLPVWLEIVGNSNNYKDPVSSFNYEAPSINDKSNTIPPSETLTIQVNVGSLTVGQSYNLYKYVFPESPISNTILPIPSSNFNKNAAIASSVTTFVATNNTYSTTFTTPNTSAVAYRCVPTSAS